MTNDSFHAVLGPTNTGKTWLAIERMCAHQTGMIGFPLRLLARENYDKIKKIHGAHNVALITGEEKIIPMSPRWYVCTVEAMPLDIKVDFLAIDEIQLCADRERGYIFTDRLMYARGRLETMFLGADTMANIIKNMFPDCQINHRTRMSQLFYQGRKQIDRLPKRTAIIAFSLNHLYHLADVIKGAKGGVAIVLGALSPRTRNAQTALYQSHDVDYLLATDAIGMGLNLDIHHISFASLHKYDGQQYRMLTPSEIGQIAGRAGRGYRNGSFGVCDEAQPMNNEQAEIIEQSQFAPIKQIYWRNHDIDLSNFETILASLHHAPAHDYLKRSLSGDDYAAIKAFAQNETMRQKVQSNEEMELLWHICQIPDFLKNSPTRHWQFLENLYDFIRDHGDISQDWFEKHLTKNSHDEGHIDDITNRLAHIRSLSYLTHWRGGGYLDHATHWQEQVRQCEYHLSDRLHELLTQRFVDRRRSLLMTKDDEDNNINVRVDNDNIMVDDMVICQLQGFKVIYHQDHERHDRALRKKIMAIVQKIFHDNITALEAENNINLTLNKQGLLVIGDNNNAIAMIDAQDYLNISLCPHDIQSVDMVAKLHALIKRAYYQQIQQRLWGIGHILLHGMDNNTQYQQLSSYGRGLLYQLCQCLGVCAIKDVEESIKYLTKTDKAYLKKIGCYIAVNRVIITGLYRRRALIWRAGIAGKDYYSFLLNANFAPIINLSKSYPHHDSNKIGYCRLGNILLRHDYEQKILKLLVKQHKWANDALEKMANDYHIPMTSLIMLLQQNRYQKKNDIWQKQGTYHKKSKKAKHKNTVNTTMNVKIEALQDKFNKDKSHA